MTTKKKIVILVSAAVFIACMFLLCGKAKAAEPKGQFFLPISARYIQDWGVAGGVAYQFQESKLILMGQVSYDHFDAQSGSVPYQVNPCRTVQVPWTAPAFGHRGVEFSVLIPLGKKK